MRGGLILAIVLYSWVQIYGVAQPEAEWLETYVNLGELSETGGKAMAEFRLVNRGKKPLKIEKVELNCGCTEADYSVGKIEKGDTAFVRVVYDPEDRIGNFKRSALVYLSGKELPDLLQISGKVLPSEETLSLIYPEKAGHLYYDRRLIDFGEIEKGKRRRDIIELYNGGENAISPVFTSDTDALTFTLEPPSIDPGEKSILTVYLDSYRLPWLGKKEFEIRGNSDSGEQVVVKVIAVINPHSNDKEY